MQFCTPHKLLMKKKKIGLNLIALRSEKPSGVESFVRNLFEQLELNSQFRISIALRRNLNVSDLLGREFLRLNREVEISHWFCGARTACRILSEMLLLSVRFFNCDSILSANNFGPLFGKPGQRRAIILYDVWFLDSRYDGPWINKIIFLILIRIQLRQTHTVFTISEFSKQGIRASLGVREEAILLLPFAMNIKKLKSDLENNQRVSEVSRASQKSKSETPFFLLIGSDRKNKNVWKAVTGYVNFCKKFPEESRRLVVVGQYSCMFLEKLESLFEMNAVFGVNVLGFVSRQEYVSLLEQASGVVFLSSYEGLGIPVLEAVTAGKPVLVSKETVCEEVAGPFGIGINSSDPAAIVDGYRKLASVNVSDLDRSAHLEKYVDRRQGGELIKKFFGSSL